MYLTRFEINPQRRAARAFLASPHRIHAGVMSAFPDALHEAAEGRVLWRVDPGDNDAVLYVVSPDKPDLTHLVEQVGRPTYGWQTRDYGPFLDRLTTGDRWAFRLRANPVHNVRPPEGGRGKRHGHVTAAQQSEWFRRQAERRGFTLPRPGQVPTTPCCATVARCGSTAAAGRSRCRQRCSRAHSSSPTRRHSGLRWSTASAPAKGYGCGLMTLAVPDEGDPRIETGPARTARAGTGPADVRLPGALRRPS